jgi:hypothetical protein
MAKGIIGKWGLRIGWRHQLDKLLKLFINVFIVERELELITGRGTIVNYNELIMLYF